MSESLSRGESDAAVGTGAVGEPSAWASDLFGQYGPCPNCGTETVTYSREFEESDLACYTCGHWLDVHETTGGAGTRDPSESDPSAGRTFDSAVGTLGLGALLRKLRSLF